MKNEPVICCGGKPKVFRAGWTVTSWRVMCKKCGQCSYGDSRATAIQNWNSDLGRKAQGGK